jgi:extradiol dioxygenase family protein
MPYVEDFPGMRNFYEQLLQASPVNTEWTDTWALFDLGSSSFALHAIPPQYANEIEISSPPEPCASSQAKLVFAVDDVQIDRKRLEAVGVSILQRQWQEATGEFDGIDPEGNIFAVADGA